MVRIENKNIISESVVNDASIDIEAVTKKVDAIQTKLKFKSIGKCTIRKGNNSNKGVNNENINVKNSFFKMHFVTTSKNVRLIPKPFLERFFLVVF